MRCIICGRELTKTIGSIGPVCRKKIGKAKFRKGDIFEKQRITKTDPELTKQKIN